MVCETKKIDSNVTGCTYAEEECLKQLPGVGGIDATWFNVETNSYPDFGANITTKARTPINPSRQNQKGSVIDLDATGGFNADFTSTNMLRLAQGFFFADARELPSTAGLNTAPISITSIDSATSTVVIDAGGSDFITTSLLFCSGFENESNNGLKTVASSTATTIVLNETLVDETPTSAKIETVGYEFAEDDISLTVVGDIASLTSTVTDFTTYGFFNGQWMFLGSDETAKSFVNNKGYARISEVSENAIIFDDVTFNPQTEIGTGLSIRVFVGTTIKNEKLPSLIKRRSYSIERTLGESPFGQQAEYLQGAVANDLTLNIPQADFVNVDMSFVAADHVLKTGDVGDELLAGSRVTAPSESAYNTSSDVYRIKLAIVDPLNSNPDAAVGYVSEASISITNGVTPNKAIGVLGSFDTSAGNFTVGGSLTAFFTDVSFVRAIRNNLDFQYSTIFASENSGFIFDMPLLGLSGGSLAVELDAPITIPVENAAAENKNGYTLLYCVFKYLPDIAMPE